MASSDSTKLCECGCGKPAPISQKTNSTYGHVKGRPVRFIAGHHTRTHGHGKANGKSTKTYSVWASMLSRCSNPKVPGWHRYGGRGIKVCKRWRSFENFLADMGEKPEGMSLDRYPDNDGDYEPGNCRWATMTDQARNRRSNAILTFRGRSQTIAEWADELGMNYTTLNERIRRAGWSVERALSTPVRGQAPSARPSVSVLR